MRPILNVSEEDRTTDTGNMRKKLGKDRACGSGDILADRQTDTQSDILITTATAPAGEVIKKFRQLVELAVYRMCLRYHGSDSKS